MRRLIESLMPDQRQIYWKWVGGVFALYVVLMIGAVGMFINHESARRLVQEGATTVAIDQERAAQPVAARSRQVAGFN